MFGSVACLATAISGLFICPSTPEALLAGLMPLNDRQESAWLYERIAFGRNDVGGTGIEPLQDVLACGTLLQKQAAIVKITRWFRPQFAPMLRLAAQDSDAAVRVQAATAIANLERGYMQQYLMLEKENQSAGKGEKLANLCYEFALSGMADSESASRLSARAVELYNALLEESGATEMRMKLARLYLERCEPAKAEALLEPYAGGGMNAETAALYLEALYQQKAYGRARKFATQAYRTLQDQSPRGRELTEFFMLWAEDDAHAA